MTQLILLHTGFGHILSSQNVSYYKLQRSDSPTNLNFYHLTVNFLRLHTLKPDGPCVEGTFLKVCLLYCQLNNYSIVFHLLSSAINWESIQLKDQPEVAQTNCMQEKFWSLLTDVCSSLKLLYMNSILHFLILKACWVSLIVLIWVPMNFRQTLMHLYMVQHHIQIVCCYKNNSVCGIHTNKH